MQAKDFLNKKVFKGKKMNIYFSNYNTLNERNQIYQNNSSKQNSLETLIINPIENYRFQSNQSLNVKKLNPPSQILHVSNLN